MEVKWAGQEKNQIDKARKLKWLRLRAAIVASSNAD